MESRVNGKKIAQDIKKNLVNYTRNISKAISFHIVYVGSDPVIDNFVKYKKQFGEDIHIDVIVHRFDSQIAQEDLIKEIKNISNSADGMIVQLPLPKHLDRDRILNTVPVEKDIDVLNSFSRELFSLKTTDFFPPVTGAIIKIFEYHNINLNNKNIVLVGNGTLVGFPMSLWLHREGYEHTIIDHTTDERVRNEKLINADVIISGAGVPHMITPDDIKEGVILIDAGTSESGKKVLGDIHPDCEEKARIFTPVPGGIGPITIAVLYQNLMYTQKKYD